MASLDVWTFQDAVDYLIDIFNVDRGTQPKRIALRAVQQAYARFPDLHRWTYFERRTQIHTVASQTTGTIEYDHTGGAFERLVTLTGATFPTASDGHVYKIIIDQQPYDIDEIKSTTTLTLTSTSNPGADVASGSSYTLFKSRYNLPITFRKSIAPLRNMATGRELEQVSIGELQDFQRGNYQPGYPQLFSILNGGEYYGGWLVEIAPPPNIAETWDLYFDARPRDIRFERYNTGTVTTDGTTTITGSGTSWTSKMAGAILRVPISGSVEPGGIVGSIDVSGNTVERFDEQATILSVPTTTSMVLDKAISTRASVAYTISDPIDMDVGTMLHAFLTHAAAEFAMMNLRKDWMEWKAMADKAVREAMSADNREREIPSQGVGRSGRLGAWAIPEAYAPDSDIVT